METSDVIALCNKDTERIFYEDLGFIYIEIASFVKEETVLQNDLDRWLYVLKNMSKMDKLPTYLCKPIFEKLFQIAEYAKLSKEEREMYDVSLKRKWDNTAVRQFQEQQLHEATNKGRQEGEDKKSLEVVESMLAVGKFTDQDIARFTGISEEFIKKVRASLKKK